MGRIIQQNNGRTTVYVTGEDFNSLSATTNTYYLGVDLLTGSFEKKNPNGNIIDFESLTGGSGTFTGGTVPGETTFTDGVIADVITVDTISATTYLNISAGGLTNTDYSGLTSLILTSGLTAGSYYLITDFQTCYDQPDFDYDGNPITSGNYKQGPVEPLMVLATSENTISEIAFQPAYPKDRILYDWSWDKTEVTANPAFGRITERIDEFNNRTDYDHRNILFKRYRLFTIRQQQPLNGTIELQSDGTVLGNNTYFTNLSVGDVIFMDNNGRFHEIINITDNTTMTVSGDSIFSFGCCSNFWMGIEETNGSGYFSYNQRNVKTYDYLEYTTFGDAISNDYVKNTYIGNYANNYQNVGSGTFLLANNVFLEGQYESNKFGDYCYNNTFGTDNQNNTWGDYCYENVSTNDIDDCTFGYYFNNNLINSNMESSKVGNQFANNRILGENSTNFRNNIIGDNFNNNTIYSDFYENDILYRFEDNIIGDFGNLDNFEFYRNYISNDFTNNTIRQTFQNNRVGTNYQNNQINGEFIGNTILNGFNNNQTGYGFRVNNIGNAFNNNIVNDSFFYNSTDYYFNNNKISNEFIFNDIQTYFRSNVPENQTLFGWSDLSTVSTRTYDVFNDIVGGGQLGNRLLGKEFVMRIISTSQYFKIKFTQWTQNGNGGGFQYTRQEIDSSGNPIGPQLLFTKRNYSNDTDIIVPGVVEITRGTDSGIYNSVSEGGWNSSVSPSDTEWNSIYTEPNSGERFGYNKIGNFFESNIIGSDFGYGFGDPYGNIINDSFQNNVIGQFMYNNVIGNEFKNNEIGNNFENNQIKNYFINNDIGNNFESNIIGNYFGNPQSGPGSPVQNVISNEFKYNKIGDYFGNNLNYPTDGAGSGGDGGNIIASDFQNNVIGNNTIMNLFGTGFTGNRIGDYFSLNSFGDTSQDNVIGNYFTGNGGIGGYPNQIGNDFTSNKIGNYAVYNQIDEFRFNEIGNLFGNSTTNEGNVIYNAYNNKIGEGFGYSFGNTIYSDFFDNLIGNNFYNNFIGEPSISGSFRRNDIGNDFRENIVYSEFQNNEIGNQFNNNICGDEFLKNTLGNGFNNNKLFYFDSNKIGDGANGNVINDGFYNNIIGGYFSNNRISNANSNNIGSNFGNNRFGSGFGFYDTSDVTSRNYDNFRDALGGNIGSNIIGRELIMLDIFNNEYYSFVFTKWTQGGNGGGFKYTRQLIYPSFGPTIEFERPDYSESTIDVIIPGVIEIKRDDNGGGIYNVAVEGSFNGSVSPTNTTWNSYFTTSNSGGNFVRNRIGNEFYGNEIIGSNFSLNDISNLFRYNENIGNDFRKNTIKSEVLSINFSTATYVYSNYNCDVFENSSNNNRLSYYDGSDVLNIVNITD